MSDPPICDSLHPLVELLAAHCPHQPIPCDSCTERAVTAAGDLQASGWHVDARRFHNRKAPR